MTADPYGVTYRLTLHDGTILEGHYDGGVVPPNSDGIINCVVTADVTPGHEDEARAMLGRTVAKAFRRHHDASPSVLGDLRRGAAEQHAT